MKICILSDSHDHIVLLDVAATEAKERGAEAILHCGDIVAPSTLKCLKKLRIPVHAIHGNNTGDLYTMGLMAAKPGNLIEYHGMDAKLNIGGKRIFLVHYPHYARAMATTGDWDLVCCGHSHNYREEWVPNIKNGKTLMLNPGTIGGVGNAPATYILLDLETMELEKLEVSKSIEKDTPPPEEDYNQPAY